MNNEKIDFWIKYAESAWDAAGRPRGLEPRSMLSNPIEYDQHYYKYFERRYIDMWLAIYSRINPVNGYWFKRESAAFRTLWQNNFSWETIWKQTLPLIVYGTTLGANNEILIELASLYCLGQAIPSMVIDRTLDDNTAKPSNCDAAFCVLAYTKALNTLRRMKLPCNNAIEDTFISLTSEMYDRMLTEHSRRFEPLPKFVSDAIRDHLSPSSRLMSSIFFGVLPIWAHTLANKVPSERIIESTVALRTVRQLNDEILDIYDDICNGLLTLPWLYALEEKPELRKQIEKLWQDTTNSNALSECQQMLKKSSAQKRAASKSLEILSQSMSATTEYFSVNTAFDITLLHNIRWALLNWLEQVDYKREPKIIRKPCLPQDTILDSPKPIEPISGGGVLVVNTTHKVLMTLVLKRGMLRWELPAGVTKNGESLEETAKREALEETGKQIEIGKAIAMCWHYSYELNKGWMGVIFQGKPIDDASDDSLMVISPQAFAHSKFNMHFTPELYRSINITNCDFEELNRLCETQHVYSTAYESVVASGFVDWVKIPTGRMHPLHRKLLEAYRDKGQCMELLVSNADHDSRNYNPDSKLYYGN